MKAENSWLILSGLAISISSFSQVSTGLETGIAMKNSPPAWSIGIGSSVRYDLIVQNRLNLTCAISYLSFADQNFRFRTRNSIFSVSGGVKYYFSDPGRKFYAAADLGLSTVNYTTYPDLARVNDDFFGISPGIGYRTSQWDFTGRDDTMPSPVQTT
ncbi:MAG TPA: hypothetical protein VL728_05570 [Cyclobacteriaceae bacterium]|jgi:hypothetical protein|nr:hypothetical protein [Cyclobacteriaceae bacterium]